MVQKRDLDLIRRFKAQMQGRIPILQMIFFGSRAHGRPGPQSDYDLLAVSEKFAGIPFHKRPLQFYLSWEGSAPLEVLCYTPEDFEEKSRRHSIVREAVETGIFI